MRVAAVISLTLATACVQTAPKATGALRVTNGDRAFSYDEGAPARKLAEAQCKAQGQTLRTSVYDRFEGGAWVFVGGCA